MKTRGLVAIFGMLWLSNVAEAQTKFNLKDCIEYGLKNSSNVKIARFKQEAAVEQGREALSSYLPQVNASGALDNNIKLQSTVIPAGSFGSTEDMRVTLGSKYNTMGSAQVDQVIFDQSLITGLKANKPNIENAELHAKKITHIIVYNVALNYYQVFITREEIVLLKDNLEKTQTILSTLQLQLDNGVIKKVDYDRTLVNLNNIKSQLSLAENNLALAKNQLKFQMGMPMSETLDLIDVPANKPLKSYDASAFEASNLTDFKIQNVNMELQNIEKDRIRAGYLPKLSAYGRYGFQSLGNDLSESWGKWNGFGSVGLKVTIPIFDGLKRDAQWKQANLNLRTQNEQLKLNVQNYELENSNSNTQLQKAKTNMFHDDENVKLAKQVYDVTALQYREGTVPLTDLLNSETSYKEAQRNYINSLLGYYQAQLGIERAQGTLLNFYSELQ